MPRLLPKVAQLKVETAKQEVKKVSEELVRSPNQQFLLFGWSGLLRFCMCSC